MGFSRYMLSICISLLLVGCVTLHSENPVVERNKRYRPTWVEQDPGIVLGDKPHFRYFLHRKKGQPDLLRAIKQIEWEGKHRFSQQGASASGTTTEDLYYEGRVDTTSRQKCFDVYILLASPISSR